MEGGQLVAGFGKCLLSYMVTNQTSHEVVLTIRNVTTVCNQKLKPQKTRIDANLQCDRLDLLTHIRKNKTKNM